MESQYERSIIRVRKTPSKNDKYHTFGLTIYYEINKPKKGKKTKKNQECLNNIRIRFPTQENECYARRTWILRTTDGIIPSHFVFVIRVILVV